MPFIFDVFFIYKHTLINGAASEKQFSGVASFRTAGPHQVTSLDRLDLLKNSVQCNAGACFVRPEHKHFLSEKTLPLLCKSPWESCVTLMKAINKKISPKILPGIHPSAWIHPTAQVPNSCSVGPFVVIEENSVLGEGCILESHAVIGKSVCVGKECHIGPHVTVFHAQLGDRVHIHSGARIGQSGFGFIITDSGPVDIPHWGKVQIGSDVVVGANTTIDRGTLEDTCIGDGTRIDNLVQVAHNVQLGCNVVLAAQTGLSGSCYVEDACILGGQVGLAPGVHLGAGTSVASKSGVMHASCPGAQLAGIPAMPLQKWKRQIICLRRLVSKDRE
ncbi:UDP-3-O-(3-hydroxymyristoyl)glucosamine N-acyltransferase [Holospora curviuscula]|uniref:UDP-3-O-acylglucosamine N-acyltransferase n=1 Tax=Holospora curviuscula TaxID=1082868 RepID=A0A2S5RE49_9PROT|nr:UDP-3-O-(3-hydroxymyristoyl)glucosamine N-acyltransferase [Holospora curviuscula]PPE05584.1 UDP-3-O-acylglucosamine N-acyltransferase [Holospora curviuscula]